MAAKQKFSLVANPTFTRAVEIPVAGGKPATVEFTFKHRTRDAFRELLDGMAGRDDISLLQDVACGWELSDPFDADSLNTLIQNYAGAGRAVVEAYIDELRGARRGN